MTGDRFCGHCGNKLERVGYRARERRYARAMFCDRACSGKSIRGEAHYAWKGDAARDTTKRERVANQPRSGPCERCGAPGLDRHHKDENPGNNAPENLTFLCRRCHMTDDGRISALRTLAAENAAKAVRPPKACIICHRLAKPTWRGRCHACDVYFRRTGHERTPGTARCWPTTTEDVQP